MENKAVQRIYIDTYSGEVIKGKKVTDKERQSPRKNARLYSVALNMIRKNNKHNLYKIIKNTIII